MWAEFSSEEERERETFNGFQIILHAIDRIIDTYTASVSHLARELETTMETFVAARSLPHKHKPRNLHVVANARGGGPHDRVSHFGNSRSASRSLLLRTRQTTDSLR